MAVILVQYALRNLALWEWQIYSTTLLLPKWLLQLGLEKLPTDYTVWMDSLLYHITFAKAFTIVHDPE